LRAYAIVAIAFPLSDETGTTLPESVRKNFSMPFGKTRFQGAFRSGITRFVWRQARIEFGLILHGMRTKQFQFSKTSRRLKSHIDIRSFGIPIFCESKTTRRLP
jgi:hypothetical protein